MDNLPNNLPTLTREEAIAGTSLSIPVVVKDEEPVRYKNGMVLLFVRFLPFSGKDNFQFHIITQIQPPTNNFDLLGMGAKLNELKAGELVDVLLGEIILQNCEVKGISEAEKEKYLVIQNISKKGFRTIIHIHLSGEEIYCIRKSK